MNYIDIVFDGPPSHECGRFVEVEDPTGRSISVGQWIDRGNGIWALRIQRHATSKTAIDRLLANASMCVKLAACGDSDSFAKATQLIERARTQLAALPAETRADLGANYNPDGTIKTVPVRCEQHGTFQIAITDRIVGNCPVCDQPMRRVGTSPLTVKDGKIVRDSGKNGGAGS